MFNIPFDGNMAESVEVYDLGKDGIYRYVSFALHASIIEKDWIDALFFRE